MKRAKLNALKERMVVLLDLPRDALESIFLKLPLKYISNLPCVCKTFNQVLDDTFWRKVCDNLPFYWQHKEIGISVLLNTDARELTVTKLGVYLDAITAKQDLRTIHQLFHTNEEWKRWIGKDPPPPTHNCWKSDTLWHCDLDSEIEEWKCELLPITFQSRMPMSSTFKYKALHPELWLLCFVFLYKNSDNADLRALAATHHVEEGFKLVKKPEFMLQPCECTISRNMKALDFSTIQERIQLQQVNHEWPDQDYVFPPYKKYVV